MKKITLLLLTVIMIACNQNRKKEVTPEENPNLEDHERIAMANGFKEFDSLGKLAFTFNVKVNDSLRAKRQWVWNRKTNKVSLTEKDTTMSYIRQDSLGEKEKYIDQRFVNDSYWLLFPFQLKWSNPEFSAPKEAVAPISEKNMKMISVSFPEEGGYTPGDTYDLYYDEDYMIREWVYKSSRGNRESPATWEDYKDFEGVKISTMHKSKDGSFELFFNNISVEK